MITKIALKSVFRTPIKTILFFVLLVIATAFLGLGLGLLSTSSNMASDANERYNTIANIEYIGENYPDLTRFDDYMVEQLESYDSTPLFEQDEVISYDRQMLLGATASELVTGTRGIQEFKETYILKLKVIYKTDMGTWCMVQDSLFSGGRNAALGAYVYLDLSEYPAMSYEQFQKGDEFFIHGKMYEGENRYQWILLSACQLNVPEDYKELAACPIWVVTGNDKYEEDPNYQRYFNMARTYGILNNQLTVRAINDVPNAAEFYQQETYIVDGEFFKPAEKGVCLVSEFLADRMGLSVGDALPLELYGSVLGRSVSTSFWYEDGYLQGKDYIVKGIFANMVGLYTTIFIPNEGESWMPESCIDYTIGQVKLQNDGVDSYLKSISPYLLGNMRVTVYDQGYARAASAISSMNKTAIIITSVSSGCTTALLLLYAYLFVLRQRDTSKIMLSMGTGKRRTLEYFLVSSMFLLAVAALVGSIAGWVLTDKLAGYAYNMAIESTSADIRFSSIASNGPLIELADAPKASPLTMLPPFALVIAFGSLSSLLFAALAMKRRVNGKPTKKKKTASISTAASFSTAPIKVDFNASSFGSVTHKKHGVNRLGFFWRTLFRNVRRNRGKSFVVPLITIVLASFIGLFCSNLESYQHQLDTVYDRIPVTAYLCNYTGKVMDRFALQDSDLEGIVDSEFVEKACYSQIARYYLFGVAVDKDGNETEIVEWLPWPESSFAQATFQETLLRGSSVIGVTDIDYASEFMFEGDVAFEFIDGYDKSVFASDEDVCLVNSDMLQKFDIELGDTISIDAMTETEYGLTESIIRMKVVGTYPSILGRDTIYCPINTLSSRYAVANSEVVFESWHILQLAMRKLGIEDESQLDIDVRWEGNEQCYYAAGTLYMKVAYYNKYNAVSLVLKDTENLEKLKDEMEEQGLTSTGTLGRRRLSMVVNETELVQSVQDLNRNISYMWALFIVMYALTIGIGFVISNLLTKSRRAEFAMMRSMGAGRARTFFMFALEQTLEFFIGLGAGVLAVYLIFGSISLLQLEMLGIYSACYIIGIVIAAQVMNRLHVLDILGAKE